MPPSPSLSARITKVRYFSEMTRISDHTISDSSPSTFSSVRSQVVLGERHPHGEERVGADVAVDDAQRPHGQERRAAGRVVRRVRDRVPCRLGLARSRHPAPTFEPVARIVPTADT